MWVYLEQKKHVDALQLCGLAIVLEQGNLKRTARAKAFVGQVHFEFFEKYKGRDQLYDCIDMLTKAHKDDPTSLMIMHNIAQVTAIGRHRCARARKTDLEKWQNLSNEFFDKLTVTYRDRPARRDDFVQIADFINASSGYKELQEDIELSQRMRVLEMVQAEKRQLLSQPLNEEIEEVSIQRLVARYAAILALASLIVGASLFSLGPSNKTTTPKIESHPPSQLHKVMNELDNKVVIEAAFWEVGFHVLKFVDGGQLDRFDVETIHEPKRIKIVGLAKGGSKETTS